MNIRERDFLTQRFERLERLIVLCAVLVSVPVWFVFLVLVLK